MKEYLDEKLHEECGVFGMYDRDGHDVVATAYYALYALQHRGQESAGIAVGAGAPAAIGALTEDPKSFGKALIFVALGEGIALYGMLISILILSRL